MELKRKRGRQPIPMLEKKVPITVWVKNKHYNKAKKECIKLEVKYEKLDTILKS